MKGTPEVVRIFGIEAGDDRVAGYDVQQREEPGIVNEAVFRRDDRTNHAILLGGSSRLPEQGELGLLGSANGAVEPANGFDLVNVGRVLRAREGGRRAGPELIVTRHG